VHEQAGAGDMRILVVPAGWNTVS